MVKKVNLGCGPIGKEDWLNVDWGILAVLHKLPLIEKILLKFKLFPQGYNVKWPKNLRLSDCRKRLPFAGDSVDYLYSSHFLEHCKKFEAEKIIKDCYRILKKGGIIRIVVPDLELLVKKYVEKDISYFRRLDELMHLDKGQLKDSAGFLLADILLDNFYPHFYKVRPQGIIKRLMNFFIRPHFWMFDFESLADLLKNAGFKNIQRKPFKQGRVPDLDYLDVFPELSLYVEAEK